MSLKRIPGLGKSGMSLIYLVRSTTRCSRLELSAVTTFVDPMAIGRASVTKINANMGASPVASDIGEELEKLEWSQRWARLAVRPALGCRPRPRTAKDRDGLHAVHLLPVLVLSAGRAPAGLECHAA